MLLVEARECHVVLGRVEAAESEIVPQLGGVDAHLQEATVEAKSELRLVRVEVVGCEARDGLHIGCVELEYLLVLGDGLGLLIKGVVDASDAEHAGRIGGELFTSLLVHLERIAGLVQP